MENNTKKMLLPFLKELIDDIESEKLSPENLQRVGEFYMSYLYNQKDAKFSEEEIRKFTVMGWYIHTQLKIE